MAKPVHSMIRVLDEARSLDFYARAFGLEVADHLKFADFALIYLRHPSSPFEVELTVNYDRKAAYELGDGYGHLAAALGPCWPAHDLCLYALDIASGLWSVLYLQPGRDHALLSAQAEYQARILPALADQFRVETSWCAHPRGPAQARPGGRP